MLVATTLIQALASMAGLAIPVLGATITGHFELPKAAIGYYISLLYFAAVLSSLCGGELTQRLGPVRVSQICLVLCGAGLALVASGNLLPAMLGALLIGLGYGPVTPASSQWLFMSTPAEHRGLIFSIKQTGVPMGGAAAGLVIPWLVARQDWQSALLVVSAVCIACAVLSQPMRATYDRERDPTHPVNLATMHELWSLICSRRTLYSLAFASFWLSTFQLSLSSYMTTYLHESFGYSLVTAGATMSAAQVAGVTGRIAWGAIADRWLGSVRMLIVLAVGMVIGAGVLAALAGDVPSWLPAAIVVTISAFSLGWNGTFLAEVTRQAPAGTAGRATGAILACTFAGVVVGPPIFGTIAELTGSYRMAFAIALIGPAIAGILLMTRRTAFDEPQGSATRL
ncbi:MFS transporter [Roseateles sp. P5_E11]